MKPAAVSMASVVASHTCTVAHYTPMSV